mmetsp:Transcript_10961/g.17958  ORF Transcript_10961/g.17958 Transcript_10961/m.17958 type:complete len:85 (-) Transcript_10961:1024-1278(-)
MNSRVEVVCRMLGARWELAVGVVLGVVSTYIELIRWLFCPCGTQSQSFDITQDPTWAAPRQPYMPTQGNWTEIYAKKGKVASTW